MAQSVPKPPAAARRAARQLLHGVELEDSYGWLRQREEPEVLDYLRAENAYTDTVMTSHQQLIDELYRELVARIPEDDEDVPVRRGPYIYGRRLQKGRQYPVYWRRRIEDLTDDDSALDPSSHPDLEIVLDMNALAEAGTGQETREQEAREQETQQQAPFISLGVYRPSPDHRFLAYSLDRDGAEHYELRVRNLATGEDLDDCLRDTAPTCEWGADASTLYYVTRDAAERPYRLFRHVLGNDPSSDELLYEESDERFFLNLEKTRSGRFLVVALTTHATAEVLLLDTLAPEAGLRVLAPRRDGIDFRVDHHGELLYVLTNLEAPRYRLVSVPIDALGGSERIDQVMSVVVPEREGIALSTVHCFRSHVVLELREGGLSGIEVHDLATRSSHRLATDEAVYSMATVDNEEFDTDLLRYVFTSPVTPRQVIDYDMDQRSCEVRKVTPVHGYSRDHYVAEQRWVTAEDGVDIPVSLVRRRDRPEGGPLLLYGYGSYGTAVEPRFSSHRLSLLDRGFAYAIAHIRGGGAMGRPWYEAAKMERKQRTFDDFIAVGEALITSGTTTRRGLAIRGGSAGGLLMGAVVNQRPDLFHAVIAEVPFVDVVNTMLDSSLPLTIIEFEEWGDPSSRAEAFEWMLRYSPYDQVISQPYPHILVTAGLNDPRVQYWEPAKWVARLRERKLDGNQLILRVDMGSGHGGASGRYDALREEAFKLAFLLQALDVERQDTA